MNILPVKRYSHLINIKFSYSPLGKAFEKQTKTIEDQGKKQIDSLADLKPKEIKPIKTKPRETKPGEYSDYFLNELAISRRSFEQVNSNDLTYKDSSIPTVKFIDFKGFAPLKIYMMVI